MTREFMIYGAAGYTGERLARFALALGLKPVLGGRNATRLRLLAEELGLEYRTAHVGEPTEVARALRGIKVLLNAAGPFSTTALPLVDACLQSQTHYLDVSGEAGVFAALHQRDAVARQRGVLVVPGVGFLVLASDCLATHVARQVQAPTSLCIALTRPAFLARGSRRTMLSLISSHVQVRRNGAIVNLPLGTLKRRFDLGRGPVTCVAISGAETYASFLTTGIPNIEVYAPASSSERALYRLGGAFAPLLRTPPAQLVTRALSDCWPNQHRGGTCRQVVVAVVEDSSGRRVARRLIAPDAYVATEMMAMGAAARALRGLPQTGFQTPGQVYGPEFLFSLPGVSLEALTERL